MQYVAYYRVSTDQQGKSGLGLEAQQEAIRTFLNGRSADLIAEFTEIESGRRDNRPQLLAALERCKRQKAVLVIAKLDRLARNMSFVAKMMDSNVDFVCTDMPHANRFTLHIHAAMAEHESEMISQRTKAALAAAKARGVKLGNPDQRRMSRLGVEARQRKARLFASNLKPILDALRAVGITSYAALAHALNCRGIPTPRGGLWYPNTVWQVERNVEVA